MENRIETTIMGYIIGFPKLPQKLAAKVQSRDSNSICFLVVLNEMLGIGHNLL